MLCRSAISLGIALLDGCSVKMRDGLLHRHKFPVVTRQPLGFISANVYTSKRHGKHGNFEETFPLIYFQVFN